jgi:hypothetical protein
MEVAVKIAMVMEYAPSETVYAIQTMEEVIALLANSSTLLIVDIFARSIKEHAV